MNNELSDKADSLDELKDWLEELGFRGANPLWIPEIRKRTEEMQRQYGPEVYILVQYIWQGGAADMYEFRRGYESQFEFRKKLNDPNIPSNADPEKHRLEVKKAMAELTQDESIFPFLNCPFMTVRAMNYFDGVYKSTDYPEWQEQLKDALCYIATGIRLKNFKMTDEQKESRDAYLREKGILDPLSE